MIQRYKKWQKEGFEAKKKGSENLGVSLQRVACGGYYTEIKCCLSKTNKATLFSKILYKKKKNRKKIYLCKILRIKHLSYLF